MFNKITYVISCIEIYGYNDNGIFWLPEKQRRVLIDFSEITFFITYGFCIAVATRLREVY